MAEFKCFSQGIEVSGSSIIAIVEGMGVFKERAHEILLQNGLKDIDLDGWYSQQAWFDAFKTIYENIGPVTLQLIGKKLSSRTPMPPDVKSIEQVFLMTDVVYHMKHRRDGKIMYDEKTGKMTEGIGHYYATKTGERSLKIVCYSPYPCVFDMGSGRAMAMRFKPKDSIRLRFIHDDTQECRRKGGESCTHLISW